MALMRPLYVNMALLFLLVFCSFFLTILPQNFWSAAYGICFSLILIICYFSLDSRYRQFSSYFIFLALIAFWIRDFYPNDTMVVISSLLIMYVFVATAFNLLKQVASENTVTMITLIQAISGYLLIGIMFSLIFAILIRFDPGAISFVNNSVADNDLLMSNTLYFTFITMATVGYGDFLPASPFARSLSAFIGITGQMYIAIVIALLIGKYASAKK